MKLTFLVGVLCAFVAAPLVAAPAGPVTVAIFAGQSNEKSLGTAANLYGFSAVPSGPGAGGINATAQCYETTNTLPGATAGSGTLYCSAPTSGVIFAGQVITADGVPAGQAVAAGNNGGNFPGASGTGSAAGAYVVTPAATVGSAQAPVTMQFSEPDIGGSGNPNPQCMIWTPGIGHAASTWQVYRPKANSDDDGFTNDTTFGPEGAFCQHWAADNPGQTLYMIKIAVGATFLCPLPHGRSYSPEYGTFGGLNSFAMMSKQVAAAEAALAKQLGITSYQIGVIQWGQGENDGERASLPCGFPFTPFPITTTPVPYLANLQDLIAHMAIPAPIKAAFTGSIAGTVLNVSQVKSGTVHQYQQLSGAGVTPGTFIGVQIDGAAGGPGHYQLQVYQGVYPETISGSGGATCAGTASISGGFMQAYPLLFTPTKVLRSCVSGGAFNVGDTLTGPGVLPGTIITGLDSAGDTADGIYTVNVNQTVASADAPEAMTASVDGFGNGADTARFVLFRTFNNAGLTGVQVAQNYVNDQPVTALPTVTVNTNDALKATQLNKHFHTAWIAELGRRLYLGYLGTCDYHSPTC